MQVIGFINGFLLLDSFPLLCVLLEGFGELLLGVKQIGSGEFFRVEQMILSVRCISLIERLTLLPKGCERGEFFIGKLKRKSREVKVFSISFVTH